MKVERTLVSDGYDYHAKDGTPVMCCDEVHRRFDLPPANAGQAIAASFSDKPGPDAIRLELGLDDWLRVGINEEVTAGFKALREILARFPDRLAYLTIYPLEVQP